MLAGVISYLIGADKDISMSIIYIFVIMAFTLGTFLIIDGKNEEKNEALNEVKKEILTNGYSVKYTIEITDSIVTKTDSILILKSELTK